MPRKKPFSNKQKKKQLQEKREKKRGVGLDETNKSSNDGNSADTEGEAESEIGETKSQIVKLHNQPVGVQDGHRKHDPNRYRLQFDRESKSEIEARKKAAQEPLQFVAQETLEVSLETTYKPGSVLDMPKRPPWNYNMSKEQVERSEQTMFENFLDKIYDECKLSELSYFERNLETWRQLWRVLEVADIVVLITDIRHPVLHFPPTLYSHIIQDLKKKLVLVLNKIDLVAPELVTAWKHYFMSKFEQLNIVCFTSFPKDEAERTKDPSKVLSKRRRRKRCFFPVGPRSLLEACESLWGDKIDLSSWHRKIREQEKGEGEGILYDDYGSSEESEAEEEGRSFEDIEQNQSIMTLGLVGHPNVGKSSLLNGLVGHKVVSTSRTPGHTKHFQTIFLTPNVRLCDCPGLVFPSVVGKQLQILSGMYPISQVQEPYSVVGYLVSRVPLVDLLQLVHPLNREDADNEGGVRSHDHPWSAWDVCDAWAHKRGFQTAKAGRTDVYRGANSLLRLAVDGKIVMCVYPPHFIAKRDTWKQHLDTQEIAVLQERHSESRRLRQQEHEGDADCASHFLAPPGRSKKDERPSSDGDDEREGEESEIVSSNPFALLSDE